MVGASPTLKGGMKGKAAGWVADDWATISGLDRRLTLTSVLSRLTPPASRRIAEIEVSVENYMVTEKLFG